MEEASWPVLPDGEPEAPALLETDADFAGFSGITISLLESCGIPVLTNLGSTGLVNRVYSGFALDGVSLWVPESRLEEAKAILLAPPEGGENDEEERV